MTPRPATKVPMMTDRDDRAADTLADREGMNCAECGGMGRYLDDDGVDCACPCCDGTGWWPGWPR